VSERAGEALAIEAERVYKRFVLRYQRPTTAARSIFEWLTRRRERPGLWALSDVSFRLNRGDSLAVIGGNGSGKSTLLKIIAGTLVPTSGRLVVNGRVSALIELGAGFHPEFSGRENVLLSAALLGLDRGTAVQRLPEIVRFSGLEEFIDVPLKFYSSGMHARLGFAVSLSVDPEILLVDEILSVGDASFREKSARRLNEFKRMNKTLVLVTHALESARELCTSGLWIHHGKPMAYGSIDQVVAAYQDYVRRSTDSELAVGQVGAEED
jgi:ABC-type polysaccharide/polyol phosphate transport system ATPase subunit